jgi:hypothetical protein
LQLIVARRPWRIRLTCGFSTDINATLSPNQVVPGCVPQWISKATDSTSGFIHYWRITTLEAEIFPPPFLQDHLHFRWVKSPVTSSADTAEWKNSRSCLCLSIDYTPRVQTQVGCLNSAQYPCTLCMSSHMRTWLSLTLCLDSFGRSSGALDWCLDVYIGTYLEIFSSYTAVFLLFHLNPKRRAKSYGINFVLRDISSS